MKAIFTIATALFLFTASLAQTTQPEKDKLYAGFMSPANAAKPRVWWHWMNGNITKEGIQKDLEWMNRSGIGGFQNFDASLFTPLVVPKKLVFMTPEWKEAFKYTTDLAQKLQLEMAIAGSPGWSVTGGPWVEPQDGMKKYVWTETRVQGGKPFSGKLPQPSSATGPFQQVKMGNSTMLGGSTKPLPTYYQDALVIAYRLPENDKTFVNFKPKVSSSGGTFNLTDLTDGNLTNSSFLPPAEVGQDMWIQYAFDKPQTFKAFTIAGASQTALQEFNGGPENRALKVSNDGVNFQEVATIPGSIVPQNTLSIPSITAKYFRFTFKTLPPQVNMFAAMAGGKVEPPKTEGVNVAEIVLHNTDRIHLFEDKAGFTPWKETTLVASAKADVITPENVLDLTSKMKADGSLDWKAPAGIWTVIRLGYSLTGRQNHPASPEATGLEVDKLDKGAVTKYINTYLDMYKDATGGQMGAKGLQFMVLDSYEAGHMTWTKALPEEFAKRRGYDLKPWIPVLTGRIVKSTEDSEKFLWDFRKTIGELITENHYDAIGEALHQRGMKRYTESHENKRIYLADGMDVKRNADIPMSAMWTPGSLAGGGEEEVRSKADIRESASVAHIYGKEYVAAESMTSVGNAFSFHPEKLKRTADMEMASGLNRFVIHTSVHQPLDDKKPGFSLGPFGQYFNRQETWAEQAKAWTDYLGRSCYLLQQGKPVVDVLYYYGENYNITSAYANKLPGFPSYEYDFVNATALLNVLNVKNGKIVTPSGMAYSVLVLDESARQMTLPVLKKLAILVKAGAKVTGVKPEKSPSLADDPAAFTALVNEIWSNPNVSANKSVVDVLKSVSVPEDVIVNNAKAEVLYVHRNTGDSDLYWLNSRSEDPNSAEISFRVTGKVPELWHPQTGKVEKVSYQIKDGRTIVPLQFESWDAYFIVFRENTGITSFTKPKTFESEVAQIGGTWNVRFQEDRGAPQSVSFPQLSCWSENPDAGIKYFSGTATYTNNFNLTKLDKKARYVMDLGEVKNIAEVVVNGKNVGTVWKKPFKLEITDGLKKGKNSVEIKVTNLWVNRLIGDAQPGVTNKITFTTMPFYQADAKLLPSGLMGPVKVIATSNQSVDSKQSTSSK
ncbi:glycosyl hydrolase [Adhaeribacter radiodurans]|uniref:Discoidin domain-containing protein n=1 Tax=Adhaeribacter radiodurans TaxID=2745197 RepID=A0A7L7L6A3_9BACT|nr:glycosyl hydrolase [Adhaeribacter radiodurans]QMU28362.1 discoidin domain-containing protein [Adhaeribacter radiodurans]